MLVKPFCITSQIFEVIENELLAGRNNELSPILLSIRRKVVCIVCLFGEKCRL